MMFAAFRVSGVSRQQAAASSVARRTVPELDWLTPPNILHGSSFISHGAGGYTCRE
jgi:hypothetical protein